MGLPLQHFVEYFRVPRAVWAVGYMGFRYSTSFIIYESLGLFGLSNPWVSLYRTSLIISESLAAVWASNPWVSRYSTSLIISESLGLFGLSNPWVSRYSTSLIISESLGAVWAIEYMGFPLQLFVYYF